MSQRPWLHTYRELGIAPQIGSLPYPSVTAQLEHAMQRYADRPAFHSFGQTLTYARVDALSRQFAAWLQARGVKPGDRVAVMTPNILAFPVAMIGILRAGAVQVNVNPLYTSRELEHQLNDAGVETIVVFAGSTATLAEVMDATPVRQVVTAGLSLDAARPLPGPVVDERLDHAVAMTDALEQGQTLRWTPVLQTPDDLLFLQYTGGTTGLSRGAGLSHGNLLANCAQFALFTPEALRPGEEVMVTAIPLYHIFALMVNFISYFSAGAENHLVTDPRDMDRFVAILAAARPTALTGVNTLYAGLVRHPGLVEVDWSRLRLAAGGGAAIMPSVSARWQEITGHFIREGYGLSETSPILSFNPASVSAFTGTTGLPLPSTDIKLLDDQGSEAAPGLPGEICARGPQVMKGYWNHAEANEEAFTADGYFRTGDVGVFDEQGFLKIVDRRKDMIIVSGFNVYPNEVEAVASACAGVAECACVGLPDGLTGERVVLFVVRSAASELAVDALQAYCRAAMAAYKIPRQIEFVDALPKSTVGKILRRELRAGAAARG